MNKCNVSVEGPIAVLEWLDTFGLDKLEEMLEAVVSTPGFHDGMPLLIIEPEGGPGPPPKDTEQWVRILKKSASRFGNRIAIAAKQEVHFGLARMLGTHCDLAGIRLRPFRDTQAAERWLVSKDTLGLE